MYPSENPSHKRPCKLNFDLFNRNTITDYEMNEIISEFNSLTPNKISKKNRVTFSPSTKKHDGMCKHNQILDRHICEISEGRGRTGIFQQMIKNKNIEDMQILYNNIMNLIDRCKNSDKESVPIISTGGGKLHFISQLVHLKPLTRHADSILSILNKLKAEQV